MKFLWVIKKKSILLSYPLLVFGLYFIFSIAHADQQALTSEFQKILDTSLEDSACTPGGVLLVSEPSIGTITVASGYADVESEKPMTPENNFRLASISKTFLAVTILKLNENGEINLDDKIKNLVPTSIDTNQIPNGNMVTVRQLLQMRSGIPNYLDYDAYTDKVQSQPFHHWVPEDGIKIIYNEKPTFSPGNSYEYSNTNYIILQSIVEELTGTSLAEQFKKYIFNPLNLQHTYQEVQQEGPGGFHGLTTRGYEMDDGDMKDVTTYNDGFGMGDGGLVSTAQDLATFVQALLQNKTLISQNDLDQMLDFKGIDKYGLGLYEEQVGNEWAYTHNGSSSGFAGQFYYFPDRKLTIVILTNCYDTDVIEDVATRVLNLIVQQKAVVKASSQGTKISLNLIKLFHKIKPL